MEKVTLIRSFQRPDLATPGVIVNATETICATLERPWVGNQHNVSCIPMGIYYCKFLRDYVLHTGVTLKRTYEVQKVPDRGGILFHCGNSCDDTRGCILCGSGLYFGGFTRLLDSKDGFGAFLKIMNDQDFYIEIVCASVGA